MAQHFDDFVPALEELFGSAGLRPSVISLLTKKWQGERDAFDARRDLSELDYVYVWSTASTSTSASKRSA